MSKIVLHDYFQSAEGGGRLALTLARLLKTDLAYGYKKVGHPFFAGTGFQGQEFGLSSSSLLPVWKQYKLGQAFTRRTSFLQQYDLAFYSGSYAPLAVLKHPAAFNVYYCHTPPRFMYDQRDFYLQQIPPLSHGVLKGFIRYLQPRYEQAVAKMDVVVTNSIHVQQRIKKFLRVDATVVHPPCDVERFNWLEQGDYYLSMARLDPLKRVDRIVQAFILMPDKKLVVCSGGTERRRLQRLATGANNIIFTDWCSEDDLTALVGKALATIYIPRDEDFGLSPLESMAAGKPVIGCREGGLVETIIPDATGLLLPADPAVELLCEAVETLTKPYALSMRSACEQRAGLFTQQRFLSEMTKLLPPQ